MNVKTRKCRRKLTIGILGVIPHGKFEVWCESQYVPQYMPSSCSPLPPQERDICEQMRNRQQFKKSVGVSRQILAL